MLHYGSLRGNSKSGAAGSKNYIFPLCHSLCAQKKIGVRDECLTTGAERNFLFV